MPKRTRISVDQLALDLRVRTCPRCRRELAGWDFVQNKRGKNGLDCYCLICSRVRYKEICARSETLREKNRARSKAWNLANVERLREKSRKWYVANTERRRQLSLAWSDANRERHYELNRNWAKANPEAVRAAWCRRYARKSTATTVPFTGQDLIAKWAYYGNRCWICRDEANATDHVKPLAKGGAHMLCNLRPICQPCNSAKRDKWPFAKEMIRCGTA